MKNKILIIAVILLGGLLIFENAYLLGLKHGKNRSKALFSRKLSKMNLRPDNSQAKAGIFPGYLGPLEEARLLQERINRRIKEELAQNAFTQPAQPGPNIVYTGSNIELKETDDFYLMKINLPGVKRQDIKVEVKDRQLIVSNQSKKESPDRLNYSYNQFFSSFLLPQDARTDQLKSDYQNGALTITIPRVKAKDVKQQAAKIPARE